MRGAVRFSSSHARADRSRLEDEVHARPAGVNTSGAETLAVLFLILICLVALLTSFAGGTKSNGTPQAPPGAPHAAALTAQ
jgi:hypothetical protein